ncbi:hypothetical protein EON65_36840 [archaeon]|nr:MAG: hypothetical protein EON65_36840 [archaeon]
MKGAWDSGRLLDKLRNNEFEVSNQDSTLADVHHPVGFLEVKAASQKKCGVVLHRINRPVIYGPPNTPNIDLQLEFDGGNIIPPPVMDYMLGVSHFIPSSEYMTVAHKSFQDFKSVGCTLYGGKVLPEGIDFHRDRPLKRNNSSRKPTTMGDHYSVFPTRSMSPLEFETKLAEFKHNVPCSVVGGGEPKIMVISPTPDYPQSDRRLREASTALFEMASNASVDPNRAFRALYFHYLLAEDDADYQWLLTGDALTYYCAHALEICSNSVNFNCEEIRDEIRCDLASIILHVPVLRSYPRDDGCVAELSSMVIFGENMSNPQADDNDYGECEFDDSNSSTSTSIPVQPPQGEPLQPILLKEIAGILCSLVLYQLQDDFVAKVNSLPANSGLDQIQKLRVDMTKPRTCLSREEVTFLNFWRSANPNTKISGMVHSLSVQFDELPSNFADALSMVVKSNPSLANALLSVVACVHKKSLASTHFLAARVSDPYQIVEQGARGNAVCVGIFDATPLPSMDSAYICSAINKCIKQFKCKLWHLRRRVIVMCLSCNLAVDIDLVNPGVTESAVRMRELLVRALQSKPGFPIPSGNVFGPSDEVHKFLVFSYGRELHRLTNEVATDCFKSLQVVVHSSDVVEVSGY